MIENNDAVYRRFAAYNVNGKLYSQYNTGSGYVTGNTLLESLQANTWYVLRFIVDDVSGFKVEAYREDNPSEKGSYSYAMTSGKSWRFNTTVRYGSEYVDDYQELDVLARSSYDAYDPGNAQWGRGQRTGMIDGSGSASWLYDQRGRQRKESKTINGSGTFVTEWSYNSAGLPAWMKYPGGNGGQQGETVTYSYHPQMLLKNAVGTTTYLQNAGYDAAGRLTQLVRGPGTLTTAYSYYQWNETARPQPDEDLQGQGGRLKQITTGTLQDLNYYYDAGGNIRRIVDQYAPTQQTQSFEYDLLNRLDDAATSGSGTEGAYPYEDYIYDSSSGNLSQKAGGSYFYDDAKKHAVRRVNGSGGTTQAIQVRAYSTPCNDGVGATMELWVNGSKVAIWSDVSSAWTTYTANVVLSGKDQVEVVYTNDCNAGGYDRNLFVDYVVAAGQTIQAEGSATLIDWGAGSAAFDGQSMALGAQNLTANGALRFVKGAGAYAAGYDANGNMTSRIVDGAAYLYSYNAENRLTNVTGAATASFVYDGNGSRVKGTVSGASTIYLQGYFEWTSAGSTQYYTAGATRLGLRRSSYASDNGLFLILGDHLGSTTLTTTSTGVRQSELLFKPWGETRFTYGTTRTSFRYTGQREEDYIKLYWIGSRWYDPYLNHHPVQRIGFSLFAAPTALTSRLPIPPLFATIPS